MLEQQVITKDLKEWAHEVRLTGNDAAHPPKDISKDDTVTRKDAEDILTLLEKFIEVLYITPALAREMRQRRNDPQTSGDAGTPNLQPAHHQPRDHEGADE